MSYIVVEARYVVDSEDEAKKLYAACKANVSSAKLSSKPNAAHIAEHSQIRVINCDHDEPQQTGSVVLHKYEISEDKETVKDGSVVNAVKAVTP